MEFAPKERAITIGVKGGMVVFRAGEVLYLGDVCTRGREVPGPLCKAGGEV